MIKRNLFVVRDAPIEATTAVHVRYYHQVRLVEWIYWRTDSQAYNPCKIPTVAPELCIIAVEIVPINTPIIGFILKCTVNLLNPSIICSGRSPSVNNSNRYSSVPKPK